MKGFSETVCMLILVVTRESMLSAWSMALFPACVELKVFCRQAQGAIVEMVGQKQLACPAEPASLPHPSLTPRTYVPEL